MTPTTTFILRDDFSASGPESIRLTDEIPTAKLLSRVNRPRDEAFTMPQLERLAREWLERLAASYEDALPEDPEEEAFAVRGEMSRGADLQVGDVAHGDDAEILRLCFSSGSSRFHRHRGNEYGMLRAAVRRRV